MDLVLVIVTAVSLLLAITMSIVAWTLIRNERQRAAARVEALEALAFADVPHEPAVRDTLPAAAPAAPEVPDHEHHDVAAPMATAVRETPPLHADVAGTVAAPAVAAREHTDTGQQWDFAFREHGHDAADELRHDVPHQMPVAGRTPRGDEAVLEPVALFGTAPAAGVAGRRWLALAAVALLVVAGVATFSALNSPEVVAAVAASRPSAAASTDQPLELLSLRHTVDADGVFTVTGLVQNPVNGKDLQKVDAVVYLFDDTGQYFASGRASLDVAEVAPGDESPFVVHIANVTGVSRYRVGFRQGDGKVVAHVDHRGQLPSGTTGDVLSDEPEMARPAGGMRPMQGVLAR